nr:polyketide synthase dehydratase domain-containing protein [Gemmatimonadota bacterium]
MKDASLMGAAAGQIDYRALLKRAYDTLEEMQAKLARAERAQREPIAIVGMGLRFPGGARDAASFWRVLHGGLDAVGEVPPDRWDMDAYFDPDPDVIGKTYSRWGAFLEGIDRFDPQFFGISPREAAGMDPQQRLLLEVSWEALENAGHASPALAGSKSGVFVGMVGSDYAHLPGERIHEVDAYFGTGISRSIAAGRLSYAFGLQGLAVAVDTACSSSAVATHLAVQSLRAGECEMALAGGVNLMLIPGATISASRARMLSPTGRCQAFAASADGYVRAEGCAMLVLKRLSDALADRDNILAVILGTATNQDGRSNGITAPNAQAQELLLRAALADAGLAPEEIGFIEAHGTGTSLGDPIELRAIGTVFGRSHSRERPLLIGSVKTNIGHAEGVAGTAGLIKLVLALQQRTIPPHLHLREPNPLIPWDSLPVTIPTAPTAWQVPEGRRRIAGVSSFGFSGTNSHIILAEPRVGVERGAASVEREETQAETQARQRPAHLLAISARSAAALEELAESYTRFLQDAPAVRLADLTYTANTGRTHFGERLAVVAGSAGEMREKLAAWRAGEAPEGVLRGTAASGAAPEVAFLFTGQGSQYVGMGRQLYESEPVFRAALERCEELLRPHLEPSRALSAQREERPLLSVLYPAPDEAEEAERLIHQTAYTQPALFALEYALAQLWRSWGIEPALVMGHSVGEYVAACVAGVFGLEDGLRLIAARGRLMQALPAGGEMASVFADEATVSAALAPHARQLAIAAVNGPRNVVVSGEGAALRALLAQLAEQGIKAKPITVSHAFHSPLMEPMLDEFARIAASVEFAPPRIGVVSNVSGRVAGEEIASAAYWREHVRAAVRFVDAIRTLDEEGCTAFLEIGPAPTLVGMAQRCLPEGERLWLPSLRPGRDDAQQVLASLGALYTHGAEISWRAVEREEGQRRIPLPTYPFQRQRYWVDFPKPTRAPERPKLHPLLDERLRSPLIAGSVFQSRLSVDAPAYLSDHRIFDAPLFPATGFLEMAWTAGGEAFATPQSLEAVQIRDALALPESGEVTLQVAISPADDGVASFEIFSLQDGVGTEEEWKLHVAGRIRTGGAAPSPADTATLEEVRARCTRPFPIGPFYERLAELGVGYGPAFRGLREVWRRDGEALARVELGEELRREAGAYQLHPALLDACIQLLGAAVPGADDPQAAEDVYIPLELGSYHLHHPGRSTLWCQARLARFEGDGEVLTGELRLFDADGALVAEVGGVHLKRVTRAAMERALGGAATERRLAEWLYALDWELAEPAAARPGWATGRWLLLADTGGVGEALAARLEAEGASCTLLHPSTDQSPLSQNWESGLGGEGPLRGVVHLWSLDEPEDLTAEAIHEHQRRVCGSTLALVQAMVAAGAAGAGLWLATRGAQALPGDTEPVSPAQAPLWGLANTISAEHPELSCVCVDLAPDAVLDAPAALAAELAAGDGEDRIAWRAGGRHVARLTRYSGRRSTRAFAADAAVDLDAATGGILDNLMLRAATRREPGPGEVEVRVRASGLNFRDVLNALGMYPGDAGPLGSECAGTVVAVGEGVSEFSVGDEVVALA